MRVTFFLAFIISCSMAWAGSGYDIKVTIDGFTGRELYLAYYFGERQYIKDTVQRNANNEFVFQGEELLPGGWYLVVMPPENKFFQLVIDENEQQFSVTTATNDLLKSQQFKGAANDNIRFRDYLLFMENQRKNVEAYKAGAAGNAAKQKHVQSEVDSITQVVETYQQNFVMANKGSLSAAIVQAQLPIKYPAFTGTEAEIQTKQWQYAKAHFFDNIDLTDERLLRTPILSSAIDQYINKLQVQQPDSIIAAIDGLLKRMQPSPEIFQFYLIDFLNTYATTKQVGMDAVYVHLALNYYAKGLAPWTDAEQLDKITSNARRLEPLLIGKTAPDISLAKREGGDFQLSKHESGSTVLYFWKNSSRKSVADLDKLKAFADKYRAEGVSVVAVSLHEGPISETWKILDDRGIKGWLAVFPTDSRQRAAVLKEYNLNAYPQIFVVDGQKKIMLKQIAVDQLDGFMEYWLNK